MEPVHLLTAAAFCMVVSVSGVLIRKNVDNLSTEEILSLQEALGEVSQDTSAKGYAAIAAFHGYPGQCQQGDRKVACCVHGVAVFPQWHRLFTVQLEQALKEKGLAIGIPYWDWTLPLSSLPKLIRDPLFLDPTGGIAKENHWFQGKFNIDGVEHRTARAVDPRLFKKVPEDENPVLFEQILNILEYHNYCQFEVQFEIAHSTIHYLVGGRHTYSLSHLEYSSYDPIFFLHHSNVDRIYAIYDALQKDRGHTPGPGCTGKCENCNIKLFNKQLEPFNKKSNPFAITRDNSRPREAHNATVFDYQYEDLTLNGYDLKGLKDLLKEKTSHDRAFAAFRLHGIGTSVNVQVKVCMPQSGPRSKDVCESAGDFFILGGPLEMPWVFSRPFYFDITKTVLKLNLKLTDNYQVKADLFSVNGTKLSSDTFPLPSVHFRPAEGHQDPRLSLSDPNNELHEKISVRKDVNRLTREEVYDLREALQKFQNDDSIDGYQATVEFHGDPGQCPFSTSKTRIACCIHGKPTFPHWHRLFLVQFEDALRQRGAHIGVPYWDWTKPNSGIPDLAAEETYSDPQTNEKHSNPFHNAEIAFLNKNIRTTRDISPELSQRPKWGDHTELFDMFLLALEQDNFCDFEIQFEIAHNLIHGFVGGNSSYGMSSLSYSGFDPIFFLHHSNVDRIWAIWTALQEYREKPYKAHCAQSFVYQPLKPFAFKSPFNNNKKTFRHSTSTNIYDYETELGYAYDSLEFGGMSIPELDDYINKNLKGKSRTFVGMQLWGIKRSALAEIYVQAPGGDKHKAGQFAVLGGPSEMPWGLDRVYRHDITEGLMAIGVQWFQLFDVTVEMHGYDGATIDVSQFPVPQIIHKGREAYLGAKDQETDLIHLRKNVDILTETEVQELRQAMASLQANDTPGAFQDLGRYHGAPKWCPSPEAEVKKSCCVHGMPSFPHWHRLWTVQAENALRRFGFTKGLPYWDWTQPLTKLPELASDTTYTDHMTGETVKNPFNGGHIKDVNLDTVRAVRHELFQQPALGEYTDIAKQVLLAFEQEEYCDFEVQFEIAHNFIHALVGGDQLYSMASLKYTAFDPLFYIHHANTDRLWAIWQALQRYRKKPHQSADCAIGQLQKPLAPFGLTSDVNPDPLTQENSLPLKVFDYKSNFHYEYDNLEFNGLSVPQLARVLEHNKAEDRVFAGFLLHGIGQSALVKFYICLNADNCDNFAGEFYLLGDPHEMDWAYNRLYLYDITQKLRALSLCYDDHYSLRYEVLNVSGTVISTDVFSSPTVLRKLGTKNLYGKESVGSVTTMSHVRYDLDTLSEGQLESLRSAFLAIQKDHTYEKIASLHGKPGFCDHEGRKVACCVHGSPTFPAWHRLYIQKVEAALLSHGSSVAVPYWDWTKPITKLPTLFSEATYFNSRQQVFDPNPFFSGSVAGEDAFTTRNPQPELYNNNDLYEQTLLALEQDNFCDFEIQFEVLHNRLHSLLGGRAKYSMATLDYAAFDPVFFLHHTNTDRIWAIWQELQYNRGLPYMEADCAFNLMRTPLKPFNDEKSGPGDFTQRYSQPAEVFDYRNHLQYEYNTLEFHHLTIHQLENVLKKRKETGRVFAGFLIHNIGLSADVNVHICVPTGFKNQLNCDNKAGKFSILGGETEMPFSFDRLFKLDITKAALDLGIPLDMVSSMELSVEIRANNGSLLSPNVLPPPTISVVPGDRELPRKSYTSEEGLVRKEVNSLNPQEKLSLVHALTSLQADGSADGYQSIAAYHALPPLCPNPEASERHACCIHGKSTFSPWHRLYTVQVEDGLRRHGSSVGLPYWDWTREMTALPSLLTDPTFTDSYTEAVYDNLFSNAIIEFEGSLVERDVQGQYIFKRGPNGWDTWLFNQVLLALEQEDYCDFETQLEITHNAIHSWMGGSKEHSMGHLHYASYDPAFFLHHANVDRIWAVWQALQEFRGHTFHEALCAVELETEPLKPFSFGSPYNLNPVTHEYSLPRDTLAYRDHFGYSYDSLELAGMSVPFLDAFIKDKQKQDRIFVGFLLHGIGTSAIVDFDICSRGHCHVGGSFSILGGSAEMPWHFDRLYKYEITAKMHDLNIHLDNQYDIRVNVRFPNGTQLTTSPFPTPNVFRELAKSAHITKNFSSNHIRRDIASLSERDIVSLKTALRDLQLDTSNDGWASLASFHGAPAHCSDLANSSVACCQHGMPTFPHWHRLFTVQIEQALARHGSAIALPYWDWTRAVTKLPDMFTEQTFYDVWKDEVYVNPFSCGYVPSERAYTVRDVQSEIYQTASYGGYSKLMDLVISALEKLDYCDFEIHFEVMHNAIHFLVGGHQTYSLSSLEYSAYDPLFFIHHSFTDKIWVVWQELQRRRHLPYNRADCAVNSMNEPMKPFNNESLNLNKFTRDHANPKLVFDHEELGYTYDHLQIGDLDLEALEELIAQRGSRTRVFAGFLLKGVKTSATVFVNICMGNKACQYTGWFNLLGGPSEAPWTFDRLFKLEITDAILNYGLKPEYVVDASSRLRLEVKVYDVKGHALPANDIFPEPIIIFDPAQGTMAVKAVSPVVGGDRVRKNVSSLTGEEAENLREALGKVQDDTGPNGFQNIASFHGEPTNRCTNKGYPASCCVHGMANFPQWHRLYMKQWEDALTAKGAKLGIPYWDWTSSFSALPPLVTKEGNNPFHHGTTPVGLSTTRHLRDNLLFNQGDNQFFHRQVLLALEQTDYCNFEVQFEITHNAIHLWTGGDSRYSMSTLEYTAYDPLFLLHHSNVDRQFAIWQALQKFRGLPYNSANCAIQLLHQPMRPFSDDDNVNPVTRANAHGIDAFDYNKFNYQYDSLMYHGMSIIQLHNLLEERKRQERIFAEFLLKGIGMSADISFKLCQGDNCVFAGNFVLLGGLTEMPWAYDRLFKYDITQPFNNLKLGRDSKFHFEVIITGSNGSIYDTDLIRAPSVLFVPGTKADNLDKEPKKHEDEDVLVRKNVNDLTQAEANNLRYALRKLQKDQGPGGYEAIAGFHGAPFKCPENGTDKFACCVHGMAVFPHWHRLLVLQLEQALKSNGARLGVPYWDWTEPVTSLPAFFGDSSNQNPYYDYLIKSAQQKTTRDIQPELFQLKKDGHSHLYSLVLDVLEEDNFCDFEVQFEILHNQVHALVGGRHSYSMATLDYSAFDPFFWIHHSSIDRIWVIWQELQKLRKKPFNAVSCVGNLLNEPLHPFNNPEVNKNVFTRRNSLPNLVFYHGSLGYKYDQLQLNGHEVTELNSIISNHRRKYRVFYAGVAFGLQTSAFISISVLYWNESIPAHKIYYLGSEKEMPWSYERIYKLDITEDLKHTRYNYHEPIQVKTSVTSLTGLPLLNQLQSLDFPLTILRPAFADYEILFIPIGRKNPLPLKIVLKKGTRVKFTAVSAFKHRVKSVISLGSLTNMERCAYVAFSYNSYKLDTTHTLKPGEYYFVPDNKEACEKKFHIQIKIEDE